MKILDIVKTIAPECRIDFIGVRPGEKINECLITEDEARHTLEFDNFFVIEPEHPWWKRENYKDGKPLPQGFRYASDKNTQWLIEEEFQKILEDLWTPFLTDINGLLKET